MMSFLIPPHCRCCHDHLYSPAAEPGLGFPGGESHLTHLPPAPQPYLGLLPYQVELSDGGSPSFDLHDGKVQPDPRSIWATVPTEDGGGRFLQFKGKYQLQHLAGAPGHPAR